MGALRAPRCWQGERRIQRQGTPKKDPAETAAMSDQPKTILPGTRSETEFIRPDADYYRTKARQCFRMARCTESESTARTLRNLGDAFAQKARSVEED
jgi:hypothetical protein